MFWITEHTILPTLVGSGWLNCERATVAAVVGITEMLTISLVRLFALSGCVRCGWSLGLRLESCRLEKESLIKAQLVHLGYVQVAGPSPHFGCHHDLYECNHRSAPGCRLEPLLQGSSKHVSKRDHFTFVAR